MGLVVFFHNVNLCKKAKASLIPAVSGMLSGIVAASFTRADCSSAAALSSSHVDSFVESGRLCDMIDEQNAPSPHALSLIQMHSCIHMPFGEGRCSGKVMTKQDCG